MEMLSKVAQLVQELNVQDSRLYNYLVELGGKNLEEGSQHGCGGFWPRGTQNGVLTPL